MKITHPHIAYSDIPRLVQEGVIKVGTRVKACEDQKKYPNFFTESMPSGEIGMIERVSSDGFAIKCDEHYSSHAFTENFFLDILSDEEEEEKDPLEALFKSKSEIEEMMTNGELVNPYKNTVKRGTRDGGLGLYAIQCGRHLVNKRFQSYQDAKSWGEWNYKGKGNWRVVLLEATPIEEEPKKYGRSPFNQTVVTAPEPNIEKAERIVRDTLPKPLSFDEPLTKEAVGRWAIDRYHNRRRIIEIALSGEAFRTSLEDGTEAVWTREEAEEKGFAFTTPPEHPDEISIEEAEKLTGKKIKR